MLCKIFFKRWLLLSLLFCFFVGLSAAQEKKVREKKPPESKGSSPDSIIDRVAQSVTGAIITIEAEDFIRGNVNRPEQLIQGKVAGLSVSRPGSNPNAPYYLRIRGLNTINGSTQPLWVIDGVTDADPGNLDPADVESITVLKDASAAALFGIRGSAGVILVRTKMGETGINQVEYQGSFTTEKVAKNPPFMNAAEWRAFSDEMGTGTDHGATTDWFDEIEQTAFSQAHDLSLSGGTDKTAYRASVHYRDVQGIQIHTGFKQLNARLNLTQKALNDRLTLNLNMSATDRKMQHGFSDAFQYAAIYNPTAPVKSNDILYERYDGYFQELKFDYYNPVSMLELNRNEGRNTVANLSVNGAFEPFDGFLLDAMYSLQSGGSLSGIYYDKNDFWGGENRHGLASQSKNGALNQLFKGTVRWDGVIASRIHLNLLGGYSFQDFTNQGFQAEGGDFLTDDFVFHNLGAALDFKNGTGIVTSYKNSNRLVAFFGQVAMEWNKFMFLTASVRYDGSSRLGANNKWSLFGSLGGGIDLLKLGNNPTADHLKLRLGYGVTGNQPLESYLSLSTMVAQFNSYYDGRFIPGYRLDKTANPDLRRERKGEFNAGIDFSLAKAGLSGSLDLYRATASDLIYRYYLPMPPNPGNTAWLNTGKMRSSGLEINLHYRVIHRKDFTYCIHVTASGRLKNTLVSLSAKYRGVQLNEYWHSLGYIEGVGSGSLSLIKLEEGKPIGQMYTLVYQGIDRDGQQILLDSDESGYIDQEDLQVTGNGLPKFLLGMGHTFSYKNWDLDLFFRGVFGHDLINSMRVSYEAPWMISNYNLPRTAPDLKNPETKAYMINYPKLTSHQVEKASFLALDNLNLGYNFNLRNATGFRKIRLFLTGNNLFYITRYKGSDPNPRYEDSLEYWLNNDKPLVPGIDRKKTWYRSRSFTLGANVVF